MTKINDEYRVTCQRKTFATVEDEDYAALLYDIYTFHVFGKYALNNKLIDYEEALNNWRVCVYAITKRDEVYA